MSNNLFGNKPTTGPFGTNQVNNNQGGGLFGANNNQGGGIFGANNNNQGGGIFGANNNNQGGGIFGANNNNQGGGLFGANNNQGGGIFGANNNNNQGGGIFGANNNNQGGGLFGTNNNNQGGLFNFGNNQQNNNAGMNMNNTQNISLQQQSTFFTSVTPVIALNKTNGIRNLQFNNLPPQFKTVILNLKMNLKNQEIKLDELQKYSQRIIDLIDQSNKSVEKMSEYNNFINKKLNKYESILNQINENFKFLSESFNQEQKNINLMEQNLGFKIDIPSKYLVEYSRKLYDKTITFNEKLRDIVSMIKIYSQESDNINFDGDLMESSLAEFIKIVRSLLEQNERQEKMIKEMFQIIFEFASNHGENPETVKNNIMQYALENNNMN